MDVTEALRTRRAVNFFDPDKPVDPALVRQMVELAALAPSSFNQQPWSLMILTDPADKARLRKVAWDQPKITDAPVVLIFLADRDSWKPDNEFMRRNFEEMVKTGMPRERWDWFKDACAQLYGRSDEAAQAYACKNTGFFGMAMMLAARELGLHTHPMDGFEYEAVRQEFNIPENYWVAFLMAVGHRDQSKDLAPPKWRKSFEDIVVSF